MNNNRITIAWLALVLTLAALSAPQIAISSESEHIDSMIAETRELYAHIDLYEPNSALILRTKTPKDYTRLADSMNTKFGLWFRYFPMRSKTEPLTTPHGQFVATQDVTGGILDAPIVSHGSTSRGVLYFLIGMYSIHTENEMNFPIRSRGEDTLNMLKFLTGTYSLNSNKTKLIWKEGPEKSLDGTSVGKYTEFARNITNFRTLIRDCEEVDVADVLPGDLYIAVDTLGKVDEGHLAFVLDVALADDSENPALKNPDGTAANKVFLMGNSLTPATSFHVIRPITAGKGAWFTPGEIPKKLKGFPPGRFFRLPYQFLR